MRKETKGMIISSSCEGILTWDKQVALAEKTGLSLAQIENAAYDSGIVPLRYKRNLDALSLVEQALLLNSRVTVVGCGGLGGWALQELARVGVGTICAWDYDSFEESNLNRQNLAYFSDIGQPKVDVAALVLKSINPAVEFIGLKRRFVGEPDEGLLAGTRVVIDALDNAGSRLALAAVCRKLDLPLIHGAVHGWGGQLCTQFPEDNNIEKIYENYYVNQRSTTPSVLSFVPAALASLQVAEAVKVILGRGEILRNRLLILNMLDMDIDILDL